MAELTAVPTQLLTDIADKIREKRDITTPIKVEDMPMQIGLIEGGSDSDFGIITVTSRINNIIIPCPDTTNSILVLRSDFSSYVSPDKPCQKDSIGGCFVVMDAYARASNGSIDNIFCSYFKANTNNLGYSSTQQAGVGRISRVENGIKIMSPDAYFAFDAGEYIYIII